MANTDSKKLSLNLAKMRYESKAYDKFLVQVKKGRKDYYKQAAATRGIGLMELFRRGADEYIANHPVESESNCAIVSAEK